MRPKLQKHSALELAGRIIPQSGGNETQAAETYNLKVTIGALELAGRIIPQSRIE